MNFKLIVLAFLIGLGAGCARPVDQLDQTFVAPAELRAVSFAGEGLAALSRSRFQEAELLFRKAHYLFPGADNITFNLADSLTRVGLYDEAISLYHELLERQENDLGVRNALIRVYQLSGDTEKFERGTRELFARAAQQSRYDVMSLVARNSASYYLERGDLVSARCSSATALNLTPTKEELLKAVVVLFAGDDVVTVDEMLQSWVQQNQAVLLQDAVFAYSLALAAIGRGDFAAARFVAKNTLARPGLDAGLRGDFELLGAMAHGAITGALPQKKDAENGDALSDHYYRELIVARGRSDARWFGWPVRYVELLNRWYQEVSGTTQE